MSIFRPKEAIPNGLSQNDKPIKNWCEKQAHVIDEDIVSDPKFLEYCNAHPNIYSRIAEIMKDNRCLITLDNLAKELSVEPKFLKHTLDVWVLHWCTFFEFGRIGYDRKNDIWFYLDCEHKQARFHFPKIRLNL